PTQGGVPYHAPRHRNEAVRVEDTAWNATGFNELPSQPTPWSGVVSRTDGELDLPAVDATPATDGDTAAELEAVRALLENARLEATLSRAQANEPRAQAERFEREARE